MGTAAYTNSTDYDSAGSAIAAEMAAKSYADSLGANYATAAQGAKADTALQPGDDISDLNNDAGYITGINSSDITTALGYTPVDSSSLATVAFTADYTDLLNTPTIPTVGDGTITFTQGGVTKGTFTTNQSGNTTIALDASGSSLPSQTGHDGEFLTTDGTDPSWGVATAVTFREWGGNE